ncbi:MAG TPA: hypothetical protein VE967_11825, partial [Gemmatimonadaceae bacterium]|nr:hypothetical protein [Gemmatimonadaceae bacterium]
MRALHWSLVLVVAGCGGEHGPTDDGDFTGGIAPPPGAVAEFTRMPVDYPAEGTIEPLGHLNPPGHTLPTDHTYFYPVDYDHPPAERDTATRTVYAPATGAVFFMIQPVGTDWKVDFRVTSTFTYYLDHIIPRPDIKVGTIVHAGEAIGTTNPGGSIDLGAADQAVPVLSGFANTNRYGLETLHCVNPFAYFAEPLRSQIYARQRRVAGANPEARIDFDVPGRLIGNWFEQSVPNSMESSGPAGWPKSLAFVYDNYDPGKVRIAIGGTVAAPGIWTIDDDAPRPESVSMASGLVAYR